MSKREERIKDFFEKFYSYGPKKRLAVCETLSRDFKEVVNVRTTNRIEYLQKANLNYFSREVQAIQNLQVDIIQFLKELAQEADKELEESNKE